MRGIGVFLWQEFRQTAFGLTIIAATLALWCVLLLAFNALILYIFSKNTALVIGTTYLPVLGAGVLLFLQENRGRVGFAYPRRLLVLPVHTWNLVFTPLLYRTIVIGLCSAIATAIWSLTIHRGYYLWPEPLLFIVGVAAVHAFVFLACGYGNATGLLIFVVAVAVNEPGFRIVFDAIQTDVTISPKTIQEHQIPIIGHAPMWAAAACFIYWSVLAYWGARQARREVPADPVGRVFRIAQRLTYFERDRATFPSPEAAQRWLEWRRGAFLFPWISLALGLVLTFAIRAPAEHMEMRFVASFNLFVVAPALAACFIGYAVTRGTSDYLWFTAARPLTTQAIARARLQAGLKAVLSAYVLLTIAFVITYHVRFPGAPILRSLIEDLRVITSTQGSFGEGLVLLAFIGLASLLMVWSLFWLARSAGIFVWGAAAIVSLWYFHVGDLYVSSGPGAEFVTPNMVFLWGMSALIGAGAVATMLLGLRCGYLSLKVLAAVIVGWAALTVLGWKLDYLIPIGSPYVIAAWFLLPFVPLASIPLTFEWQRHR